MTMLTVPAEVVGPIRDGLHSALGEAAQEIDTATLEASRDVDPDLYTDMLARFDRTRALLDTIGWIQTDPPVSVRLGLREHRDALLDALEIALGTLDAQAAEASAVDAEPAQRGQPPRAEQMAQRARTLHEFATVAKTHADWLGGLSATAAPDRELTALGRTVRGLRRDRSISVAELAIRVRLTPARVEAIDAGQLDPRFDVLLALSRALGVDRSEIIRRVEAEAKDGGA